MLRLNPTRLRLDARDLTWHTDRHKERQALRAAGPPTNVTNKTRSPKKKHIRAQNSPSFLTQPLAIRTAEAIDKHESSAISSEPVPHDSRSFWDRVLADAGTPTRTQTTSLGNATVIEPSDDFLENSHSSRASIEDDHTQWQDGDDIGAHHSDDLPSPCGDTETDVCSQRPVPSSSGSLDSTRVEPSVDANMTDNEQNLPPDKNMKTASEKRRLSFNNFNFFRRKVTPDFDGSPETNDHHNAANRDIDGRYKSRSSHERSRSDSSNGSAGGDLRDGLYGSRRDRRTISSNLEACVNGRIDAEGNGFTHLSSDAAKQSISPTMPVSQHSEDIPRHASGLPRSSLYISQAAMSSSPHKAPDTVPGFSETPVSEDLLALPPRRRKRYKARSESYPFMSSEDLEMSALPQLDGPSISHVANADLPSLTVSYPSTHSMVPTPPSSVPSWSYDPVGASAAGSPNHEHDINSGSLGQYQMDYEWSSPHEPYQDSAEIHSNRSLSSMGSHHIRVASHSPMGTTHSNPSRRNLSPFAETFVPRSARRHASPQLPLPPPFSATPRNLSLNSVLPSSSLSPHTPPSRPPSASISPVPHTHHAHIPVYNDAVSPTAQPQTPAELSRNNRRPRFATHNPFNTAPARPQGPSARAGRLAQWQAFGTPTRRPSARTRNHEQENVGAVDAEERLLRRQMALGLRMGREEMERHG